jgi:prepilin-type N-terminal cleavage/methylation domain-containing protein
MPAFSGVTPRDDDRTRHNRGFSLVELSIVLVILGLLVGGVLTGKSLIRAAELRSITTEVAAYQSAVMIFKEKYQALPGDMTNATRFWGKLTAYCNGDAGTASATGTCNGNGDGKLDYGAANDQSEIYMLWNQLALAGLISGTYTGVAGTAQSWTTTIVINAPASKMTGGGYIMSYLDHTAGDVALLALNYYNSLVFGKIPPASWAESILTPEEAWNIDKKIDDAHPAKGHVISTYYIDACMVANSGALGTFNFDTSYNLSEESVQCTLAFMDVF